MSCFILKNHPVRQKLSTPFRKEIEAQMLSDSPTFTMFADLKGRKSEILTKSTGCSLWLVSQPLHHTASVGVFQGTWKTRESCGGRG